MTGSTFIEFDKARNKAMQLIRTNENKNFGLLIMVGINAGLRYSDLIRITFKDLRQDSFIITEVKTGKTREIGVNDNIKLAMSYFPLEDYPDNHTAFKSQKGTVYSNKHVNRLLQGYFKGNRISSHSLRKSFGRRVYNMNGMSQDALNSLSEVFNHKDISTTRRYLGIRQEEINEIYMNL